MIRRLFTLSVLSLVLCVVTVALWARSYWVSDSWHMWLNRVDSPHRTGRDWHLTLVSVGGELLVFTAHGEYSFVGWQQPPAGWGFHYQANQTNHSAWHNLGFGFALLPPAAALPGAVYRGLRLMVPHWLLLVPAIAIAFGWMRKWRKRKQRMSRNSCTACSYDLTGNVSGICPECGKSIEAAVSRT